MGGMENFHMQAFFYMRLPLQTIFLCVCLRFPANTFFFYLHTIYFSIYSLCKQFISKFATPPPRQKNNGPSLTATM